VCLCVCVFVCESARTHRDEHYSIQSVEGLDCTHRAGKHHVMCGPEEAVHNDSVRKTMVRVSLKVKGVVNGVPTTVAIRPVGCCGCKRTYRTNT